DADDRRGSPVERHCTADDVRIASEAALPEAVADHRRHGTAHGVVVAAEQAACGGVHAQRFVVAAGDERAGHAADGAAITDIERIAAEAGGAVEEIALIVERADDR